MKHKINQDITGLGDISFDYKNQKNLFLNSKLINYQINEK